MLKNLADFVASVQNCTIFDISKSNKMENQTKQPTTTYQSVIKAIEECNDLRTLKFALLDTIDNMKATNLDELLTDLIDCYGLGENKENK